MPYHVWRYFNVNTIFGIAHVEYLWLAKYFFASCMFGDRERCDALYAVPIQK